MSLKDLTKEQKQYVALGLLASSIVVILMVLGIRFSMATVSAAKEELDDLSGKISKANRALSRSRQTSEDYVETVAVLRDYLTNAPPDRNYYSWATEVIYSTARFAGLEIDSIDEISIPHRKRSGSDGPAVISFESYSLRIMAHGGYENTKYFLNLLNQDYPMVRFSGVEISSGQNRDKHDIQLFIQWPFNFDEISKNWDAVASKKMEVAEINDGEEAAALKEPDPVEKPAAQEPSIAKPISVVEPYPPTTRPEVKETPVPEPMVEPTTPKAQPGGESGSQITPSSEDTTPKPATDKELEALLSYAAPSGTEILDAEPQSASTVSEPMAEPMPDRALEAIAAKPEAVMETAVISDLEAEPMNEQVVLPLINAFEMYASAPAPEEPQFETIMEAMPQTDASSELAVDSESESSIDPQPDSIADVTDDTVSTGKSDKNLEDRLNQESAEEDISMSSLLQDMMGKSNEK